MIEVLGGMMGDGAGGWVREKTEMLFHLFQDNKTFLIIMHQKSSKSHFINKFHIKKYQIKNMGCDIQIKTRI